MKNLVKSLPSSQDAFKQVYEHTFQLAKVGNQKAVQLDMATAYWTLLFSSTSSAVKWSTPSTPWLDWWIEFLNTSWKKSVNKDMWTMTLKFARQSLEDEDLSFWSEEASWPSVVDEFVEWVGQKRKAGVESMETE